jgi:6-phosphogluconolactonase
LADVVTMTMPPTRPAHGDGASRRGRPAGPIQNRIYDDYDALSRAAAALFIACAREALQTHQDFRVALSGGRTPARMFALLAASPLRTEVPWSRVQVFWGDERCVPADDERSNAGQACRQLLDRVPLQADRIYPMACEASPAEAALSYEQELRRLFGDRPPRFDLIFLGLGSDGHTASLFPGSDLIAERRRLVREVPTAAAEPDRVSFTPVLINQAAIVAFLVSGAKKADTVRAVQQGPYEPQRLPAQAVRPRAGRILWLLDRAAASRLEAAADVSGGAVHPAGRT